jgi:hypothetical protein
MALLFQKKSCMRADVSGPACHQDSCHVS